MLVDIIFKMFFFILKNDRVDFKPTMKLNRGLETFFLTLSILSVSLCESLNRTIRNDGILHDNLALWSCLS